MNFFYPIDPFRYCHSYFVDWKLKKRNKNSYFCQFDREDRKEEVGPSLWLRSMGISTGSCKPRSHFATRSQTNIMIWHCITTMEYTLGNILIKIYIYIYTLGNIYLQWKMHNKKGLHQLQTVRANLLDLSISSSSGLVACSLDIWCFWSRSFHNVVRLLWKGFGYIFWGGSFFILMENGLPLTWF